MPLKVGNVWIYKWVTWNVYPNSIDSGRIKIVMYKDTILNSKKYFYFRSNSSEYPGPLGYNARWIRYDSLSGRLMGYNNMYCPVYQTEFIIDSLPSKKYDTVKPCSNVYRACTDTGSVVITGHNTLQKRFNSNYLTCECLFYAKDIGIYGSYEGTLAGLYYELKGCIIDGIIYGDTTLIGLTVISSSIPHSFAIYQNYPNPFNPSTKIKFDVPKEDRSQKLDVRLVIYDVLGREGATLVNEQLAPGTYEVDWDASNYPSGVYFYTLQTESFNQTKRMVLIK